MSATGWYPDPSGVRGRYRYWDGSTWSESTTTDPSRTAPPSKDKDDERRAEAGNKGWLVALIILVVLTIVAVIVMLFATRNPFGGGHATEDTNSSTPTISAWDETSTPTTPPPPTDLTGGVWVDCPISTGVGDTKQKGGRISAAGLSAAIPSGYSSTNDYISMAYDQHAVGRNVPGGQGFWSAISVGLASNADGFVDISTTAMQLMQCNSMTYHPIEAPADVIIAGEPMTISGHAAWHVRWQINYTEEAIPGEILDSIAVDMGPGADYVGVYWSCRPLNNADFEASITSAINSLTVT